MDHIRPKIRHLPSFTGGSFVIVGTFGVFVNGFVVKVGGVGTFEGRFVNQVCCFIYVYGGSLIPVYFVG